MKRNLTAINWAHAVNNQQLLQAALSGNIDMIEADIVLGKLNGSGTDMPIMAHPPANSSDLSLADFLNQIKIFNEQHGEHTKGIKLDFKSIEVFEGSKSILEQAIPQMTHPIWLNADIISGPVQQTTTVPVDPERFLAGCAQFKQAVLSIGWTTRWGPNYIDGLYNQNHITAMLEALKSSQVLANGQLITFPVRAGIAAHSTNELHDLIRVVNQTNQCSLTIWSSEGDAVNVQKLRNLIFSFGVERVYLDVPEQLANQLNLDNNSAAKAFTSLLNFMLISLCFWSLSKWLQRA